MKIATIAYLHGAGGAERQICMLTNALADLENEVHLIILAENEIKYKISDNVMIHDLSSSSKCGFYGIVKRFVALKKVMKKIQPDISIHFWFQSAYFCAFMDKKYSGKIVYAERGDPSDKEYNGLLGMIRKTTIKRIDGFVFQSEAAKNYFDHKVREKSIVIHNPVSVPENLYCDPCMHRNKKIVNVGRLYPQKNQKLLVEAFAQVHKKLPDYIMEIYGDGLLEDELRQEIFQLSLDKKVFLYPSRKDIFTVMYESSLFVLSSDYEGMPNVLMEAMALGVPCLTTDYNPGSVKEIIDDGINGYIVPPGNAEVLAKKMIDILQDDNHQELCRRAQQIRSNHSQKHIYLKWEKFLKEL